MFFIYTVKKLLTRKTKYTIIVEYKMTCSGMEIKMPEVVDKLIEFHKLNRDEYAELLKYSENAEVRDRLSSEAVKLRKEYYGDKVFTRGLIEFTNYCKNDCYYCGIRKSNKSIRKHI